MPDLHDIHKPFAPKRIELPGPTTVELVTAILCAVSFSLFLVFLSEFFG